MKRINTLVALLLFVVLVFVTPQALAQCNTQSPNSVSGFYVHKYFTPAVMGCNVKVNNAAYCNVLATYTYAGCGGGACIRISATANPAATMPESCSFTCSVGCTSLVIDGPTDGLPVELMEFSLDE